MAIPWIMITIAVVLILLFVVFVMYRKKHKGPTDYYALFTIGITWVAIGLPLKNPGLWGLGFVFMIIGLVHKKKWKKNHRSWNKMTNKEQRMKLIILMILGIILVIGIVAFLFMQKGIL